MRMSLESKTQNHLVLFEVLAAILVAEWEAFDLLDPFFEQNIGI